MRLTKHQITRHNAVAAANVLGDERDEDMDPIVDRWKMEKTVVIKSKAGSGDLGDETDVSNDREIVENSLRPPLPKTIIGRANVSGTQSILDYMSV